MLGDAERLLIRSCDNTATNLHMFLCLILSTFNFFRVKIPSTEIQPYIYIYIYFYLYIYIYKCIHQTSIKMHGMERNPFNPTDPIQRILYAHLDHVSRCFTISRVLRGLKAVSAHAIRSSKAAPGSLGVSFSKLQFFGEKYVGKSFYYWSLFLPKMWREKWTKSG